MTNKVSVVKILGNNTNVSSLDIENWRNEILNNKIDLEQAKSDGKISVDNLEWEDYQLVLVKIGGNNYSPTIKELNEWRDIFERISTDPDFYIFTNKDVNIEIIDLERIASVNSIVSIE